MKQSNKLSWKKRLFVLAICIPFFPIQMVGEWYENAGGFGYNAFSFRGEAVEYWSEVIYRLTGNYSIHSKGIAYHKKRLHIKKRQHFTKAVAKLDASPSIKKQLVEINKMLKQSEIVLSLDYTEDMKEVVRLEKGDGWGNRDWYHGFNVGENELVFFQYADYNHGYIVLDETDSVENVYANTNQYTEKKISTKELEQIIYNFTHTKETGWSL